MQILHEDNHIIVVIKPFNVPTMSDSSKDPDMLSQVREYLRVKYSKPGNVYTGLVHRLDRPTGGVMVFAKTSKAAARLSEAIREDKFDKRYFAVLCSVPRERAAVLKNYLLKDETTNTVSVVPQSQEGAKYAELSYKVVDTASDLCLADIDLETGRSHQIRVQFKNIKCPIFGDVRYGGDKLVKGHNLALWSYQLRFEHPTTKTIMVFRAAPPFSDAPWSAFPKMESDFENLLNVEDAVRLST